MKNHYRSFTAALAALCLAGAAHTHAQEVSAVMRPAENQIDIAPGFTPLTAQAGPWGHKTVFFSGDAATDTVQTIQTQFFCGGGNGYSTIGIVQGGKGFLLGGDPGGNFASAIADWPNFPGWLAGSILSGEPLRIHWLADLAVQPTPPNPPAGTARVFARVNGSGKVQLCVIFPTGAVKIIETED